jgi:hypothetical protein
MSPARARVPARHVFLRKVEKKERGIGCTRGQTSL